MTLQNAENWYVGETVATASPAKLLTLLYDKLAKDLGVARSALLAGRRLDAEDRIDHAREILLELMTTLDGRAWEGAADLAQIYAWMTSQLIAARVQGDAAVVANVQSLVMELGAAWHAAAEKMEHVG
jgi:flagellar protein FliS